MKKKIKVVIIEDDLDTVKYLEKILIKENEAVSIEGFSCSISDAIDLINKTRPEIVLMDIVLKDGNAFSILDAFPNPNFEVIFISAHGEFMEKALEYYALNFLTKPINANRLLAIFKKYNTFKQRMFEFYKYEMLKEMIHENGKKFLLHIGNKHIAVNFSDIIRCVADGNYTLFYLSDKRNLVASKSLGYYSDLLEKKNFFRASRFDLINLNHITSIYKKETIVLSNNDKVNISTRNKSKLVNMINELSL